jgi:hypothetical protein
MHCLVYWLTDATAGRHSSLTHLIQSYSNLTRAVRKVNKFQHIVVCLTKPIFRYEIVFVCFSSVTRRMPVTHPSCSWVCFAQYMLLWSILSTSVCLYIRFLLVSSQFSFNINVDTLTITTGTGNSACKLKWQYNINLTHITITTGMGNRYIMKIKMTIIISISRWIIKCLPNWQENMLI